MTLDQLRTRHPRFTYDSYTIDTNNHSLAASFHFTLEPDIVFTPRITIPINNKIDDSILQTLVFHLGLIESISYWKAACPGEFIVMAGYLSDEQIAWWRDLFIAGLGEFYFKNGIDFTQPDFLKIKTEEDARVARVGGPPRRGPLVGVLGGKPETGPALDSDLILVGGGKDSAVTLELLKSTPTPKKALLVNPTPAAVNITQNAGYDACIVKRTIDPKLLELNNLGYLNGHTPFSALLAFVGITAAFLSDYRNVIASNEQSASEGNVLFHGIGVNHQYSKSYEFEKRFREYCKRFLTPDISYFSFLRPLYDLQIAKLFAGMTQYHGVFRSCNVGRGQTWCGTCPKCAFVYLTLSAFLPPDTVSHIFGSDFFTNPHIQTHIAHLVGLDGPKPFECVGTKTESVAALLLTLERYNNVKLKLLDALATLLTRLRLSTDQENAIVKTTLNNWNTEHFLPTTYEKRLKEAIG